MEQTSLLEPGTGQLYPKVSMPYQNSPYEEPTSESSQIKEQHETTKLINEEVRMLSAKTLKTWIIN